MKKYPPFLSPLLRGDYGGWKLLTLPRKILGGIMINVAVIGVGYWGPNLIRNFIANPDTNMKICCDLKEAQLKRINTIYPAIEVTNDYKNIINDPGIDLVTICTPVFAHYQIAKDCLQAGKNVLIEKPMTSSTKEAEDLLNIAERKNIKIFTDHTFVYTGSVRKIKELIIKDEIGDLLYFDSVRINLGLFQHDVNVLWDLAPHDISIMHYLLDKKPEGVVATGADHLGSGLENVAYLTVYYPDNLIAHIHTNWLSPVKIRETLIAGTKKMVVWDDNQPSEKVRIYDKGIDVIQTADEVYNMLIQYRTGDMYCPKIDGREALAVETQHIVDCLTRNVKPIVDGKAGWMIVKILEAAQESIKQRGKEIKI
jgi:predicted dehydrogenase